MQATVKTTLRPEDIPVLDAAKVSGGALAVDSVTTTGAMATASITIGGGGLTEKRVIEGFETKQYNSVDFTFTGSGPEVIAKDYNGVFVNAISGYNTVVHVTYEINSPTSEQAKSVQIRGYCYATGNIRILAENTDDIASLGVVNADLTITVITTGDI